MSKKNNILLISSLILAFLSALIYAYFYNSLNESKKDVANFYEATRAAEVKLKNLQDIEQNLRVTVAEGETVSALFLRHDSIVNFIQTIEGLMKEVGVTGSVDSVTEDSSVESNAPGKEKLTLVISSNGKWSGMVNLLGLLERLPYKSTINSFTLTNVKTEDSIVNGKKKSGVREWQLKVGMIVWAVKKTNTPTSNDSGDLEEKVVNDTNS